MLAGRIGAAKRTEEVEGMLRLCFDICGWICTYIMQSGNSVSEAQQNLATYALPGATNNWKDLNPWQDRRLVQAYPLCSNLFLYSITSIL
jgi:hypothetical protein